MSPVSISNIPEGSRKLARWQNGNGEYGGISASRFGIADVSQVGFDPATSAWVPDGPRRVREVVSSGFGWRSIDFLILCELANSLLTVPSPPPPVSLVLPGSFGCISEWGRFPRISLVLVLVALVSSFVFFDSTSALCWGPPAVKVIRFLDVERGRRSRMGPARVW
ncbi:hypothetical protein PISMIDRAFT_17094 [Pisolithus microcarpus 441]|uniref:Uncharacterized protein n=1 Tax=Pisolithus microcarpus 441 TaxID=765257 RepID=A0A0C9YX13_9AGAM|nr:hypothetical protein PISMIDRAFT_17094 [Pisolithus microcarpus 441]